MLCPVTYDLMRQVDQCAGFEATQIVCIPGCVWHIFTCLWVNALFCLHKYKGLWRSESTAEIP